MVMAKVTLKGQITIPKDVREKLAIAEGDFVFFQVEENRAVMRRIKQVDLLDFYGAFPTTKSFPGKEAIRTKVKKTVAGRLAKEEG